jgi:hypothetical protein
VSKAHLISPNLVCGFAGAVISDTPPHFGPFINRVLDVLSAICLASSIVQFVLFAQKPFSRTSEIKQSVDGSDRESADLETVTKVLDQLGDRLPATFEAISGNKKDILCWLMDGKK